jgi:hypothetical protein
MKASQELAKDMYMYICEKIERRADINVNFIKKYAIDIDTIRAEARSEALMKVEDLIHKWWFDDGDSIETLIKAIKELKP